MSNASTKVITLEEFKQKTTRDSLHLLIHNKVYNVSKFIDEHPGGDEVMLAEAGKDATEAFEDVGHSDEARSVLQGLYVGDFEKEGSDLKDIPVGGAPPGINEPQSTGGAISYIIPLGLLGVYFAWRYYF